MEADSVTGTSKLLYILTQNLLFRDILAYFAVLILLAYAAIINGTRHAIIQISPEILFNHKCINKHPRLSTILLKKRTLFTLDLILSVIALNLAGFILCFHLSGNLFENSQYSQHLQLFIRLTTISLFMLVFTEITPRLLAGSNPDSFLKFIKFPAYFTHLLFYPLGSLIHLTGKSFNKLWLRKKPEISMADFSNVIELSSEETSENKKILESIVNYGSFDAVEIMKPRVDIVAFDISTPFDELLDKIKNHNYSRIPIYTETYDNIKGILYVKDLLPHFHKKTFNWQTLIRPAYFVPESKKINDLLRDFQSKKIHMAIVTDEYGGTSGIVTLEDILEEIVGEITDELDFNDEISFKKIDDNNYIFDGKTPLNDFCKTLQLHDGFFDEITGDAETLAGILLEVHGELPKSGVAFNFKQFTFLIISSDKRRIKQIKITRNHLK